MIRLLLALFGLVLITLLALAALWLLGEVFSGLGSVLVTAAGVLGGVLRFVVVAGVLGGLAYILGGAWTGPGRSFEK